MPQSEIAQLRAQIERELISMRQGLYGLATGVTRHQFIEAKMHRLGNYEDQLAIHIGKEQATQISCQAYIRAMEENEQQ
ncbi:MAG: hypothetical protein JO215_15595 [Ktedonobacteraceae bacterium]|nr:hypothetical protein [Ktedonobacteraceae bacterium]